MKKFITSCLILCAVVIVQLFYGSNVSASPVNSDASSISSIGKNIESPIPKLIKVERISPNQLQINYDRDVDMKLGKRATNYWIQNTKKFVPRGIATLGRNEKVNSNNSLTDKMVKIEPKDGSAKTFILTFNQNISSGEEYKLIICYVAVEGAPPYNGDNGMAIFIGK